MRPRPNGKVSFHNAGRAVLVSGGAQGIGRAICEQFLESDAQVLCMDIDRQAAADLPDGIEFIRG